MTGDRRLRKYCGNWGKFMGYKFGFEGQVMANIGGLEVPFLVDTGATLSLLNFEPKGCKASDKIMM